MKQYNLLVDFTVQGYNIKGNIFTVLRRIYKERNSRCSFKITKIKK